MKDSYIRDNTQLQKMNNLIQESKIDFKLNKPDKDDNTFISGIFGSFLQKPKNEDDERLNDSTKTQERYQGPIKNSMINFQNKNQLNCLDDLMELMQQSHKKEQAMTQLRNGLFEDKEFPANASSILGFNENKILSHDQLKTLRWLHSKHYF